MQRGLEHCEWVLVTLLSHVNSFSFFFLEVGETSAELDNVDQPGN